MLPERFYDGFYENEREQNVACKYAPKFEEVRSWEGILFWACPSGLPSVSPFVRPYVTLLRHLIALKPCMLCFLYIIYELLKEK